MTRTRITSLIAALLIAGTFFVSASGTTSAEEVEVESNNFYFCSASFFNNVCETTIATGDTVTWNNVGGLHTVTQCDDDFGVCPPLGGFDSGFLNPGDTFSQTFDEPGVITYWCDIHPVQMRGRILVEDPPAPTSSPVPSPSPEPTATPDAGTPAPSPVITPAEVPPTGAVPGEGSMPSLAIALAVLGVALVAGSSMALANLRRR